MPAIDKQQYDVLNVVALKKLAPVSAVAVSTRLEEAEVTSAFSSLAQADLLVVVGGSAMPTDDAAQVLDQHAADFYANVRTDPEVLALVERFDQVNDAFLTTMSSWQQVKVGDRRVANDHTDEDYDAKVIDQLDRLVARLGPLIEAFVGFDARFSTYRERFDQALEKVDQGATEYVSSPTVESVHNVWFEFHEDLLRTLGRERQA